MRLSTTALAAASLLAATAVTHADPEKFVLDKSHTAVTFTVDHIGYSLTHGRFSEFDADVMFDPDAPENSTVTFTIDTPSVDTGWPKRDEHVRNADFLDVDKHPEITFVSKSIEMTGEDTAKLTGDLTMNGTTREESFEVKLRKMAPSPFGAKKMTAGFQATGTIDRTNYGIDYGKGAIGTEIPVQIDLEIVKDG